MCINASVPWTPGLRRCTPLCSYPLNSLPETATALGRSVSNGMGGSSGALYHIFFTAVAGGHCQPLQLREVAKPLGLTVGYKRAVAALLALLPSLARAASLSAVQDASMHIRLPQPAVRCSILPLSRHCAGILNGASLSPQTFVHVFLCGTHAASDWGCCLQAS